MNQCGGPAKAKRKKRTPDYFHVLDDKRLRDNVYEPEADSFLFLDAIDAEIDHIATLNPLICVEIGCGSGIVVTHLQMLLRELGVQSQYFAVDINPIAIEATHETLDRNGSVGATELIRMDLLSGFAIHKADSLGTGMFDIVLFNPPYVPTSSEEVQKAIDLGDHAITAAWSGGADGRVVIDRLLEQIPRWLTVKGRAYIVAIRENKPDQMIESVRKLSKGRVEGTIVASRFTGEHLCVICFERLS